MQTPLSKLLAVKGNQVVSAGPETTVADCVHKMNKERIGAVLVVEGERPVGMFTERDVLTRILEKGRDPATTRLGEVMSKELACIAPSATVGEALRVITDKRFRHLPVVEGGKVVGMLSIGDLTRWLVRDQEQEIKHLTDYIAGSY